MDFEEQLQLVQDIQTWLQGRPSLADMKFYISRIPEEHAGLVADAAVNHARQHALTVRNYFVSHGMEWIPKELPLVNQHGILGYFAGYSRESVLKALSEQYPGRALNPPQDIHIWAQEQLHHWVTGTVFLALPEYVIQNTLRRSLLSAAATPERRQQLQGLLEQAALAEQGIAESRNIPNEKQFAAMKSFLAALQFIPENQQMSLLDLTKEAERRLLYFRVGAILAIEKAAGSAEAEHALLEYNRLLAEDMCYVEVEHERREWVGTYKADSDLTSTLSQLMNLEMVANGQSRQKLEQFAAALPPERREKLQMLAAAFCPDAYTIVDFMDPLSGPGLYDEISKLSDEGQLPILLEEFREAFEEEDFMVLQGIAGFFYAISHNLTNRA